MAVANTLAYYDTATITAVKVLYYRQSDQKNEQKIAQYLEM